MEYIFALDVVAAECHALVEKSQCIAHRSVRLAGYHVQRFVIYLDILLGCNALQIAYYVRNADTIEVVGLAPRQDSRENLVFLRSTEDEDGMCRRFFKGLEEGIES